MAPFTLLAYCLGIGLLVFLPSLQHWPELLGCIFIVLLLSLTQIQTRPLLPLLVLAFGVGAVWHLQWAAAGLSQRLPEHLEGEDLEVIGQVVSVPISFELVQQFVFHINKSDQGIGGRVRLSHYDNDEIFMGDRLRLKVRLNRPHSLANPGSFDREAQMLRSGVIASGYVREVLASQQEFELSLVGIRGEIYKRLKTISMESNISGLIAALVLGEKSAITEQQSELFVNTGTVHLFVISGLHIGLVAGVFFYLSSIIVSVWPPVLTRIPRQKIAGIVALMAAVLYSALAGFSLPTQRAVVMLGVFILCSLWDRQVATSYRLLLAVAIVLSLDPLAPLSAGFWYSFAAVAGLLFLTNYSAAGFAQNNSDAGAFTAFIQAMPRLAMKLLKPQLMVFIVLLLPLLFFGGSPSVLSPLINSFAIPVVGLLLVPLCLLLTLLLFVGPDLAPGLMAVIVWLFDLLLMALEWVAQQQQVYFGEPISVTRQVALIGWLGGLMAVFLLLAPVKAALKLLAVPLMLPVFWPSEQDMDVDLAVHVLDVGQGLAVVIRTRHHALLYDTGFGIADGYSAGEAVVVPALFRLGVKRLDAIVISHGDSDHIGGLQAVLAAFPETTLISNPAVIAKTLRPAQNCGALKPWQWDDARFEFLSLVDGGLSINNQSCVLRVSLPSTSLLLPGDIERPAELLLIARYKDQLKSALLLAPHHGSKSSSSYPFLKQVQPKTVIVSAGYNNRFDHPSQAVTRRYEILGMDYFVTSQTGMLSLYSTPANPAHMELISYRKSAPRYWR